MKRVIVAASVLLVVSASQASATCAGHFQSARTAIGAHVETLGEIETQLVLRLSGGRNPSYAMLARETRAIVSVLYPRSASILEQRLRRCRNWVPPIRRTCRDAALRLVNVIEESAARRLTDETRLDYARLIDQCERWLALPRRQPRLLRVP